MRLERFTRSHSGFPDGRIEPGDEPDFIVHTKNGRIGIEHTEIFRPGPPDASPLQAQESLRRQIVERAKALHRCSGGPVLHVSVFFGPYARLTKKSVLGVATRLAKVVCESTPREGDHLKLESTCENTGGLPPEIDAIHIYRLPEVTNASWTSPDADYVPHCTPDRIQEVRDKKDRLWAAYRQKCDVVWDPHCRRRLRALVDV